MYHFLSEAVFQMITFLFQLSVSLSLSVVVPIFIRFAISWYRFHVEGVLLFSSCITFDFLSQFFTVSSQQNIISCLHMIHSQRYGERVCMRNGRISLISRKKSIKSKLILEGKRRSKKKTDRWPMKEGVLNAWQPFQTEQINDMIRETHEATS